MVTFENYEAAQARRTGMPPDYGDGAISPYRVVQLNLTPFYRLFDRSLIIFSMTSPKQHMNTG